VVFTVSFRPCPGQTAGVAAAPAQNPESANRPAAGGIYTEPHRVLSSRATRESTTFVKGSKKRRLVRTTRGLRPGGA